MITTFQVEKLSGVREEIEPLLYAHFLEIAHFQDIPLDPDWTTYEALEQAGALRIFTVRDEYRALIGYAVFAVHRNPHYRGSLQATQDILFLDKPWRGRTIGYRFLAWCDDQLRDEGVQVVRHHFKVAHDLGPIFARLGYEDEDRIVVKRLDRG